MHYDRNGMTRIGYTAVYNCLNRITCRVKKPTKKLSQANDTNHIWRKARFNFALQLALRLGLDVPEDKVPNERCFDINELEQKGYTFKIEQVCHWDEKHIKQRAGFHKDEYVLYPRDENGVLDPNSEIHEVDEKVR